MALNRTGRVVYLDAPGTYNTILDATEFGQISLITLVADNTGGASAVTYELDIYGNAASGTASQLISVQKVTVPAGQAQTINVPIHRVREVQPDTTHGLSAVLTGTGGKAFIWLA